MSTPFSSERSFVTHPDIRNAPKMFSLVEEVRTGDAQAWENMYGILSPDVFVYLLGKTRNRELSADLMQNTMLKVATRLDQYSPQRGASFRTWVMRIAHNEFIDELRRVTRRPLEVDMAPLQEQNREPTYEQKLPASIDGILDEAGLSPDQKEVMRARFGEGQSINESATSIGKSVNSIKALQHGAIVKLRQKHLARVS